MAYINFSIQDFVLDEYFRRWVLSPEAETNDFWNQWLSEHPERYEDIQIARKLILGIEFENETLSSDETESMWDAISAGIEESDDNDKEAKQRYLFNDRDVSKRKSKRNKLYFAASILLILGSILSVGLWSSDPMNLRYAVSSDYGETKAVRLKDGSLVTLNANSTITYQDNWGEENVRKVWLKGEAYFEVIHKENNQAFVVEANGNEINVLGTKFNVYAREQSTSVLLTEGKVVFTAKNEERLEMTPGDLVSFNNKERKLQKEEIELKDFTFWKDGNLVFRSNTLAEISNILKHTYDIDVFFLDGSIADRKFTGVIPSEDIDVLIESLSKALDLSIERKKNVLIIKPKE